MAKLLVVFLVLCATLSCFAAPVVQSIGSDVPISTTYTTVITVVGTGFTGATQVKISGITCGSLVVHSATEIECVAQPGLGSGNEVSVKVGSNIGSAKVLDFEAATSHACGSTPLDLFSSSTSKAIVSICGSNFGDSSYTTDDSDWTGTLQVVAGKKVKSQGTITYHDDSVLVVEFSSGTGQKNPVFVVLGSKSVEVPDLLVTFDPPTVSSVVEDNRRAVVVTDIVRLAIYGRNFGTPSPTTIVQANVGGFKCNINLVHVSDTLIRCSVKNGFGANRDVEVISNGYSSNTVIQIGNHTTSPVSIVSPVRYDFPNAFVPGFDCAPPTGAVDVVNPEMCNCWSGYAPLSAQPGTECSVRAVCPGKVASKTTANFFGPSRPTYKFEDDTLWIVQTQPIVANRRDTLIEFVVPNIPHRNPNNAPGFPGAPTCMYPGVLWEKKINELDCLDEFHGRMPWSQNEFCGWVEDTDVENLDNHVKKFKTSMVTTYTETYKGTDGKLRFRKMSNSYLLTVSFTRQIVAFTTSHVNVYINEPSYNFNVEVQDDAFYDVASHQVLINFVTTVAWPYQLDDLTLPGTWRRVVGGTEAGSVLAEAVLNQQPGDLECTTDQDTDCSQSWLLTISGDACDLHGSLEFSTGTLLCRDLVQNDAVNCMFTTSTNFTIQIGKTDLCDNAPDVDATEGLTHSMESFYDQAHTIPQNAFQTGDMIYFIVRLNDPISSIDSVTFNSISVASTGDSDDLYAVQTAGDLPTDPDTTILSVAQVNVTHEIRQPTDVIAPGTDAILTFQFRLLRNHLDSLDNLAASYESSVSLTLTAVVDIWYHGNQKRTISLEGSASSTAHASISYYSVESELEEIPTEQNENAQTDAEGWTDEISFFSNASTIYSTSVVFIAAAMIALLF